MKKILLVVLAVILNSHVALAESNFLNSDWWETATVADVQKEISNGEKVNAVTWYGNTALMFAARRSSAEVIKVLINTGADINAKNKSGETALKYAVKSVSPEVVKVLVDAGADVNAKDREGRTVLMYAAWQKSPEIVKILVNAGGDVNAKDKWGGTAWSVNGNPEVNKLLEEAGAKTSIQKLKYKVNEVIDTITAPLAIPLAVIAIPYIAIFGLGDW